MALDQCRAETPYGPMLRAVGRVCCWCDAAGSWCWGLASFDRIRFSTMQPLARPVSITRDNLSVITLITVGGSVWLHRIEWPAFRLGQAVIYSPWSHTQVKIIFLCLLWFKWQMTMANMVTFIMLPFVFLFVCNTTLLMLHLPSSLGPEIRACSSKLQRYLCMLLPTPEDKFFF